MDSFLTKIPEIIGVVTTFLGGLVFIATGLARVSSSETVQKKSKSFADKLEKIVEKLPTIGTNPATQKLKNELKELKQEKILSETQKPKEIK